MQTIRFIDRNQKRANRIKILLRQYKVDRVGWSGDRSTRVRACSAVRLCSRNLIWSGEGGGGQRGVCAAVREEGAIDSARQPRGEGVAHRTACCYGNLVPSRLQISPVVLNFNKETVKLNFISLLRPIFSFTL